MSNVRAIRRPAQHRGRKQVSAGECRYFTYNDVNLVTTIEYPGGVANYFWYDAMMRRYAMQDSSGLRYFTWDQNDMNLVAERDAAGTVTAYYTHGFAAVDGIGSAVAVKQNRFGAAYYQYPVYDHRGTVVRVLDQNGAPTGYFEYDAWGNELRSDVVGGGISENRFGYQSNWITLPDDPSKKLKLSPTRLYHAGVGRFLGRDSEEELAGDYAYAGQHPVATADPSGRASQELLKKGHTFFVFERFGFLHKSHRFYHFSVTSRRRARKSQVDAWNAGDLYAFMPRIKRTRGFDKQIGRVEQLIRKLNSETSRGCQITLKRKMTQAEIHKIAKDDRSYMVALGHGTTHSFIGFTETGGMQSIDTTSFDAYPRRFRFLTCGRDEPVLFWSMHRLLMKHIKELYSNCRKDNPAPWWAGEGCGRVYVGAGPFYSLWVTAFTPKPYRGWNQVWDTYWHRNPKGWAKSVPPGTWKGKRKPR